MGRPVSVAWWTGREMAGRPFMLNIDVKLTVASTVIEVSLGASVISRRICPAGGGWIGIVGVTRMSKSRPHWAFTERVQRWRSATART
jgi:hypothetical protein